MNALIISTTAIRQDAEGRYSLNDLHRAAGGERRHQPSDWMRLQQTQDLIAELGDPIPGIPGIFSRQGLGTYVVKELVYAYTMWISAQFHLRVIRAYDALQAPAVPQDFAAALRLAADQQDEIRRQREELLAQQPKVEFAEAVRNTVDAISISDMAKLLGTGQNRLFRLLRSDRILLEDNKPYQEYLDRGYFRLIEMPWRDDDGQTHVSFKTLVTGKGQVWLQRRYAQAASLAHAQALTCRPSGLAHATA